MSTDLQPILDALTAGTEPTILTSDNNHRTATFVVPDGHRLQTIDLTEAASRWEHNAPRPRGTTHMHDPASLADYIKRHKDTRTEVWADETRHTITAILNSISANGIDGYGWGDHRATYKATTTDAWNAWVALDGKLVDQTTFAEHIEDRAIDVVNPDGATMLELAQTFHATTQVRFESSKLLSSGERQLEYRETVDAKAGRAGKLDIPKEFALGLAPFRGSPTYKVTARLRYRILDGSLRLGYRLTRPGDVLDNAFNEVVDQVQKLLGNDFPIWGGEPPQPLI